jgi:hypothetical protein
MPAGALILYPQCLYDKSPQLAEPLPHLQEGIEHAANIEFESEESSFGAVDTTGYVWWCRIGWVVQWLQMLRAWSTSEGIKRWTCPRVLIVMCFGRCTTGNQEHRYLWGFVGTSWRHVASETIIPGELWINEAQVIPVLLSTISDLCL